MKISFPKYGPGELLTKRGARFIISSVIIGFLAGVVGSYLLENHFWLLTIAVLGIASILVCLGAAVGIFLNWNKVDGAPSAHIKENLPRITSEWHYQPKETTRAYAAVDSAGSEAPEALTPEHFAINNDVWLNNDSLEAHTFVDVDPTGRGRDDESAVVGSRTRGFNVRLKSYRRPDRLAQRCSLSTRLLLMKKFSILMSILIGFAAASLQAGEPVAYKQVAPQPPPELYGLGFYGAIDMGANIYQDRGGTRTFEDDFGFTLEVDPKNDVGFFGGLKLGYVFGTGVFRPTIEGDFFYNGFRGGADFTLRDPFGDVLRESHVTSWINTGAFMGNFIARFAFGRFQPYVGAGVGIYYAESAGVEFQTPHGTFSTGGGQSHADLAWQIIAGTDYYWTPKFSTFIEYKFLEYTSTQINTNENRELGQHLLGAGARFHF